MGIREDAYRDNERDILHTAITEEHLSNFIAIPFERVGGKTEQETKEVRVCFFGLTDWNT